MSKVEIIKKPIEQVGGNLKKSAWSAVIESLAIIILGILLIIWPETMITVISYVVGIIFIVKGGYQIVNYLIEKGQNDFFNNSLLSGVISILIGITALVIGEDIAHVFRVIIGVFLIYESLVRMNTSIKLHSVGISSWSAILILSLIMLILGVFVTFNTGAIITLVGWMMILAGIVGIIGDIMFIQHVNTVVDKLTGKN
ncbi:DUF308 domain-containing protein [Candidatus Saccharibacteria bacterium]|nr:DUF308 domain-containing protein [Candidatus Saccharibacteria bacterium]